MPNYYYYIVNLSTGGVLTIPGNPQPGAGLVVQPKIPQPSNNQLWFIYDISNTYIQNVQSMLVLEKQTVGPPDEYWVNLAVANSGSNQKWQYNPTWASIANPASDTMLSIWGGSAVVCAPPIGLTEVQQAAPYAWQIQIAGITDADEPAEHEPPPLRPETY